MSSSNPHNGLQRFHLAEGFEEPEMQFVGQLALTLAMNVDSVVAKDSAYYAGIDLTFAMLQKILPRVSVQTFARKNGVGCVLIQLGAGFAGSVAVHASRCASDGLLDLGSKNMCPVLLTKGSCATVRNRDLYDLVDLTLEEVLTDGGKCISFAWVYNEASGKFNRIDRVIWPAAEEGREDADARL